MVTAARGGEQVIASCDCIFFVTTEMSSITKRASVSIEDSVVDFTEKGHSVSSRVSFLKNVPNEGKNVLAPGVSCNVKILNQSGADVTPQPLNFQKRKVRQTQQSNSDQESFKERRNSLASHEESTVSELASDADGFLTSIIHAPFGRNVFGVSLSSKPIDPMDCSCDVVPPTKDNPRWEIVGMTEGKAIKEERKDRVAQVLLLETKTQMMVELPSIVVGNDPVEVETVTKANEKYKQLLQSKEGSDAYLEKSMVTFNKDSKSKSTQTPPVKMKDASSKASPWECYDSIEVEELKCVEDKSTEVDCPTANEAPLPLDNDKISLGFEEISLLESFASSLILMERMLQLKTKQSEFAIYRNLPVIDSPPSSRTSPTPASPQLELSASLKTKQPPHGHPPTKKFQQVYLEDQKAKVNKDLKTISLKQLWSFASSITSWRGVNCFAWNAVNLDLLVVGHGLPEKVRSHVGEAQTKLQAAGKRVSTNWKKGRKESSLENVEEQGGLVCCWSIKNPEHPERIYKTDDAVKSVAFCHFPPNLLAVGLESGVINIYNVSSKSSLPIISSFSKPNKHQGPVWSLKWKNGDVSDGRCVSLISVSSDGKVLKWTTREEFECTVMLEMRRMTSIGDAMTTPTTTAAATTTSSTTASGNEASFVSKLIGGMCLDFSPFNENVYLVGSEHGDIHKCDCAYTDQFMKSYKGHAGQVYEVLWSPFNPQVFLSCGSDWTVRLWVQNQQTPVLTMFSSQKSVRGICWSPKCSTMFATVNSDQLQVWNLAVNLLEPILRYVPEGPGLTRALFSLSSDCILIGQRDGQVLVLKLIGISYGNIDQEEALNAVIDSCEVVSNK